MVKKKKIIEFPRLAAGCQLIDTHCHLDMESYAADLEEVISHAGESGVKGIITIGIDLNSSRQAITIAQSHEQVFATVGVHPHHVQELVDEGNYGILEKLAGESKVVGFGEIGIDTVKNYAPIELQKEHFARQVKLGRELGLPLVVHDREAHGQIMEVLSKYGPYPAGGVMHCFSGDAHLAQEVMKLGFYISIPGVVTFNKAEIMQEAVRNTPVERLLIETDGPYLAPVPRRGKRNEPALLLFTAAKVAELKGMDLDELARVTTQNARRLFNLDRHGW